MGLYALLNENDRIGMRKVTDTDVMAAFDEAYQYDYTLMISAVVYTEKRFLRKPREITVYTIYHEVFLDNGWPAYQARQQVSASGSKELAIAYLHGIINANIYKHSKSTIVLYGSDAIYSELSVRTVNKAHNILSVMKDEGGKDFIKIIKLSNRKKFKEVNENFITEL